METAIYATIYTIELYTIEKSLMSILVNKNFKRIEQGTVLIYEDKQIEISIEPHLNSFYLSGRVKTNLLNSQLLINKITDYQEENESGISTTPEFNISNLT
jgi:hypothetical protein